MQIEDIEDAEFSLTKSNYSNSYDIAVEGTNIGRFRFILGRLTEDQAFELAETIQKELIK